MQQQGYYRRNIWNGKL